MQWIFGIQFKSSIESVVVFGCRSLISHAMMQCGIDSLHGFVVVTIIYCNCKDWMIIVSWGFSSVDAASSLNRYACHAFLHLKWMESKQSCTFGQPIYVFFVAWNQEPNIKRSVKYIPSNIRKLGS